MLVILDCLNRNLKSVAIGQRKTTDMVFGLVCVWGGGVEGEFLKEDNKARHSTSCIDFFKISGRKIHV